MMVDSLAAASGVSYLLAAMLVIAAVAKAKSPHYFATSLQRLLPARTWSLPFVAPRRLALLVAAWEGVLALGLVTQDGASAVAVAAATLLAFTVFLVAIRRAIRLGVSCGCFGHLSKGPAGPAESMRGSLLLAASAALLLIRLGLNGAGPEPSLSAFMIAGLLGMIAVAAHLVGARVGSRAVTPAVIDSSLITPHSRSASRREFIRTSAGVVAGGFGLGTGLLTPQIRASAAAPDAVGIGRTIQSVNPPTVTAYQERAVVASDLIETLRGRAMPQVMARNLSASGISWAWESARAYTLDVQTATATGTTAVPIVSIPSTVAGDGLLLWLPTEANGAGLLAGLGARGLMMSEGMSNLSWLGASSCQQNCINNLKGCITTAIAIDDACKLICTGWLIARNGPAYINCMLGCQGNTSRSLDGCDSQSTDCLNQCLPPVFCDCLCDTTCTANGEIEQCTQCECTDGSMPAGCVIGFPGQCKTPTVGPIPCPSCTSCPTPP